MKHILFVDPLEKLTVKKDSSLLLAATMQKMGIEVYLVFEENFYVHNRGQLRWQVSEFESKLSVEHVGVEKFLLTQHRTVAVDRNTMVHMRLDPPFDGRYLRYLWMLELIQSQGVKVVNGPGGIARFNEKLYAYQQPSSIDTFVGRSEKDFMAFIHALKSKGTRDIIVKPLDLFQGMGVEKVALNQADSALLAYFQGRSRELQGGVVVQPFVSEVSSGELRSIYFKGKELGTILKVPQKGEFLANIAQGASYQAHALTDEIKRDCERVTADLGRFGVDWIAFDILDGHISEVNITCPGLLYEVSKAAQRNLAMDLIKAL